MSKSALDQASRLIDAGRPQESLAITAALVTAPSSEPRAYALHSAALKALGRREEALGFDRRAVGRFPQSRIAWHNLGATLGDLGQSQAAIEALDRAFGLGLDAPETWLVYARALAACGAHDKAEEAYRKVVQKSPANPARAGELAEFLWMRQADLQAAFEVLAGAETAGAAVPEIRMQQARLLETAGEGERALELLSAAAAGAPHNAALALAVAQAAIKSGQLPIAESQLRRAAQLLPGRAVIHNEFATLQIAQGRPDLALKNAFDGLQVERWNQSLWGLAATAARLLDDPIYPMLCDYEAMVAVYDLEAPEGWDTQEAFLGDLGAALHGLHGHRREPANQSVRNGSQTTHLLSGFPDPAIRAAFTAFDVAIRSYMSNLGSGADPLRSRNTGAYRIQGAWSVLLGRGGFHTDHLHMEGWISSAFYVEVPKVVATTDAHEGWLRFGASPLVSPTPCPAERYVQPRPGRLVLFPSYMWHGVVPFSGDEQRLTMAFDLTPA